LWRGNHSSPENSEGKTQHEELFTPVEPWMGGKTTAHIKSKKRKGYWEKQRGEKKQGPPAK